MDEWQLLDEVDVFQLWAVDHKKNVQSAKWLERKEALESLSTLIDKHPRLCTDSMNNYTEIIGDIKKILLKDSNINVVIAALCALQRLAKGLRTKFAPYVPMILHEVLEKSKDKKQNVRDAVGGALDALALTCEPDRLTANIVEQLQKPSPLTKQCVLSFLFRYFLIFDVCSPSTLTLVKSVLPVVVKLCSDSDKNVRDEACTSLASAKRLLGEAVTVFVQPIAADAAKMKKIEDSLVEARKRYEEEREKRGGAAAIQQGNCASELSEKTDERCTAMNAVDIDPWDMKDVVNLVDVLDSTWNELIVSKNWKDRQKAVDDLLCKLEGEPRLEPCSSLCELIAVLIKVVDKDINVNVGSAAAKALNIISKGLRFDFSSHVPKLMSACFTKMKDKKPVMRNELIALCDAAALTCSLCSYSDEVIDGLSSKNPQSRSQTAFFLSRLIGKHDSTTLQMEAMKQLAPAVIKCSTDADSEVREASFRVVAAVLKCIGEKASNALFSDIFEDSIKAAKVHEILPILKEEFGLVASPEIKRLSQHLISTSRNELSSGDQAAHQPGVPPKRSNGTAVPPRPPTSRGPPTSRPSSAIKASVVGGPPSRPASASKGPSSRPNCAGKAPPSRPATAPNGPPTQPVTRNRFKARPAPVFRPVPVAVRPTAKGDNKPVNGPSCVRSSSSAIIGQPKIGEGKRTVQPRVAVNVVRRPVTASTANKPVEGKEKKSLIGHTTSNNVAPPRIGSAPPSTKGSGARTGIRPPTARISSSALPAPSLSHASRGNSSSRLGPASKIGSAPSSKPTSVNSSRNSSPKR